MKFIKNSWAIIVVVVIFIILVLKIGNSQIMVPSIPPFIATCNQSVSTGTVTCDVQLSQSIEGASAYFKLKEFLDTHTNSASDTVVFHLSGYGGLVDGTTYLTNMIQNLKANTVMSVEGDVYSAHAVLAFVGKTLVTSNYGLYYFHASSGTNMGPVNCLNQVFSLDRGHWGYTSCLKQSRDIDTVQNGMLHDVLKKVLTAAEMKEILNGDTLILSVQEIKRRIQ